MAQWLRNLEIKRCCPNFSLEKLFSSSSPSLVGNEKYRRKRQTHVVYLKKIAIIKKNSGCHRNVLFVSGMSKDQSWFTTGSNLSKWSASLDTIKESHNRAVADLWTHSSDSHTRRLWHHSFRIFFWKSLQLFHFLRKFYSFCNYSVIRTI